ncbi:alpha/beta-hydrolase [Coniochaeta ligniaria NRRL 30616]|uniref:Alpha/beta-hydrolase n=1 Tax=Coniochaeta ligniaria NRRL 30616 TaxID=1408157 RepID=A0A1J7I8H0_9PEZI|nr:alpha/beta-hydrolase [Coniochaeta ligniaria NRRL 30616]
MEAAQLPDEELPLIEREQTAKPRQSWNRKLTSFVLITPCLLLFQLYWLTSSFFRHTNPSSVKYLGEHISWERCGDLNGRPLECSSIDVPMDQFDAANSGNKTFAIPLIRLRGENATQNLLLNPGGPGVGGMWMLQWRGEEIKSIVGEDFHLLSFDPRGVNRSAPQTTCYPDDETRTRLSDVRSARAEDSPELYAWTHNFVQACLNTTGEHGLYVNSPQTAADMNSILDAVGQQDMFYWGFSYGTIIGQTYATLFPERAKRVIIDGVVNQFTWYDGLLDWESMADTEQVLQGFYDECIRAGPDNCALTSLAESQDKLSDLVESQVEELRRQPIGVYVNNSLHGLLTCERLWFSGVFPGLYDPRSWSSLAHNLAALLKGNATAAYMGHGQRKRWKLGGDANRFIQLNDGLSGSKYWEPDRQSLVERLAPLMEQSSFSPAWLPIYYAKQQWLYPRTHHYTPRKGVKTAGPLLILSTTFDPVCPLASAQSANEAFEGSRIVEVQGYGHCSMAVTSTCAMKHVRDFLCEGQLPEKHKLCAVDSPYFVKPEEDGHR